MNEFRRLKLGTNFDNEMIASLVGVDVAVIHLFELQVGIIDYNTAMTICSVLDATFFEMFPGLAHLAPVPTEDAEGDDPNDMVIELFESEENRVILIQHGLDPDVRPWYAHIHLKSGNERRYRLSSLESARLQEELSVADDDKGCYVFYADCQNVIIRRSAISNVRFTTSLSYAPFSSEERGLAMTLLDRKNPRPIETGVAPDDPADGPRGTPLIDLIQRAREGKPLQPFIRMQESDDDIRFIHIEDCEVIEIPVGLTVPGFYDEDEPEEQSGEIDLETAEAQGSA